MVVLIAICLFLFAVNFVCLGFASNGISSPLQYGGGDTEFEYYCIKGICDNGWFWGNDKIGAPYGTNMFDFPVVFILNFENLLTKIVTLFSKSPFIVFNILYLFTFVLCGITSFFVLRTIGVKRVFSAVGAIVFGMSPYIYNRGVAHFSLGACYFIPLSILLCFWSYFEDDRYLKLKGFFTYKKNIFTVVFALLIANNGIGYYPFLTCFFLCIIALMRLFEHKTISAVVVPFKIVFLIVLFMLLAVSPCLVYKALQGSNDIARRELAEQEVYGLKLILLFLPLNYHGITKLGNFVNRYLLSAPLITENRLSYLGFFACVGFLISTLYFFVTKIDSEKTKRQMVLCKLNLSAVLFFTIGGFIVLFSLVTNMRFMRAFNRVSIYIEFMSIVALCLFLQQIRESSYINQNNVRKYVFYVFFGLFFLFCIWEQHPSYHGYSDALKYNKACYENDDRFIKQIEKQLSENDAVFQFPYHKFPESGPVNSMSDYGLFRAYLHSSKLRWSYGGMKGRKSDRWNEKVSYLPMEQLIPVIVQSGFRGIYIDARAYKDSELKKLCLNIESVLTTGPSFVSDDKLLYFYNLYNYAENHPDLIGLPVFNVDYLPLNRGEFVYFHGEHNSCKRYVSSGLSVAEPEFTWTDGHQLKMSMKLEDMAVGSPLTASFNLATVFNGKQHVIAKVNDETVFDGVVTAGNNLEFPFMLPDDGLVSIVLELPDACSPKSLGQSEDSRILALAIQSFEISDKSMIKKID